MIRRYDIIVDIGEILKQSGVIEIQVLDDRCILYGKNRIPLGIATYSLFSIMKIFLKMQNRPHVGKVFTVQNILDMAYQAREIEVNQTVGMIKNALLPYIKDDKLTDAFETLNRELYSRL